MCDSKKEIYLEKINYYTSINDVYKMNKYNYKYDQLGGNSNLKNAIEKLKNCSMTLVFNNNNNNIEKKILIGNKSITNILNNPISKSIEELKKYITGKNINNSENIDMFIDNIANGKNKNYNITIECYKEGTTYFYKYKYKDNNYIFE